MLTNWKRGAWYDYGARHLALSPRGTTVITRGIALIGPNRAVPFFHLLPVFGSAMAIVFLGKRPRLFRPASYLPVLAGVIIAPRRGSASAGARKLTTPVFAPASEFAAPPQALAFAPS